MTTGTEVLIGVESRFQDTIKTEIADMTPQEVFEKYIASPRGSITEMLLERTLIAMHCDVTSEAAALAQSMMTYRGHGHRISAAEVSPSACSSENLEAVVNELLSLRAKKMARTLNAMTFPNDANADVFATFDFEVDEVIKILPYMGPEALATMVTAYFERGKIAASVMCELRWLELTYTNKRGSIVT